MCKCPHEALRDTWGMHGADSNNQALGKVKRQDKFAHREQCEVGPEGRYTERT